MWREDLEHPVIDYRMTRLTFGVSASSFTANMALRQNALEHLESYPQAVRTALKSFYIDDSLLGKDLTPEAVQLRRELQHLFKLGGFKLRKWKSSDRDVFASIPEDLRYPRIKQEISYQNEYTKVLWVEWNVLSDCF